LLQPSTRRTLRKYGFRQFLTLRGWHWYVYGRWPRLYIGTLVNHAFGLLTRLGPKGGVWLADHYHGKVLTLENARSIITVNREIPLRDLDQIVPYRTARNLLLQGPPDVAVFECPCRLARDNPCRPTQVCLVVGQPFVDLLLEHHPNTSRRLTQQEALDLLEAEHGRGHVHSAWFKDVCLDRFFAICNCCRCCCAGIEAMVSYGIPAMASSGYVAQVDHELCRGCGECEAACAFRAIRVEGQAEVDVKACMGCGVCENLCTSRAVFLVPSPDRGIPLDVRQMVEDG
jgi:ferredoxin